MDKNLKIYVAGHRGLVGSALVRNLEAKGYANIIKKTSSELDLTDTIKVFEFFEKEKPDWVFLAAAKVGGIHANSTYPVDFMLTNLKIQNNVIEASYKFGVKKLMFLGSSCIYPKNAPQPMKEECLLTSELEPTNEPYALAKISGRKLRCLRIIAANSRRQCVEFLQQKYSAQQTPPKFAYSQRNYHGDPIAEEKQE